MLAWILVQGTSWGSKTHPPTAHASRYSELSASGMHRLTARCTPLLCRSCPHANLDTSSVVRLSLVLLWATKIYWYYSSSMNWAWAGGNERLLAKHHHHTKRITRSFPAVHTSLRSPHWRQRGNATVCRLVRRTTTLLCKCWPYKLSNDYRPESIASLYRTCSHHLKRAKDGVKRTDRKHASTAGKIGPQRTIGR